MSYNCYIYWDDKNIYIQCEECHKINGWGTLWPASYGYRSTIICKCGKIIHEQKDEDESN
jgi:hypothetical protein